MFWKILKYLGLFVLTLLIIVASIYFLVTVDPAQRPKSTGAQTEYITFREDDFPPAAIEELAAEWGKNKFIPAAIRLPALLALRQYPELKDKKVVFHYAPAAIPLSSRPSPGSVFQHANNRTYNVFVSSKSDPGLEPILIHSLPFDSQVAILAHELGHSLFYTQLTGLQIAKFGMDYALKAETRAIHEKGTDSLVVYRGLGLPLYEYATWVRSPVMMGENYIEDEAWVDQFYLKPGEIKEMME
ncbi:MAG: hypothetical protein AAFU03_03085 [Bacteroidota bacterium]